MSLKNSSIIYRIKNLLGFGNIRKLKFLDTIIIEFYIQDSIFDLLNLIYILNGNFRCPVKLNHFEIFYKKLKVKLKKLNLIHLLPDFIKETKKVSLSNS
jgi:hypothetical protein